MWAGTQGGQNHRLTCADYQCCSQVEHTSLWLHWFYHHLNNNRAQRLRDALTHRVVANVWNLSLWKELCTKKVMWCYLSGDTCRSAEYCSVFLRFSGGYRWLHLCDDGAASLCQSFKEERLIPLLFSSFGWAKFPVRALETSLDVCEKDGCPGYATHEKQSWCCWITAPVQEAKGFLQTQIQIIFAGPPITFQRALSIAWWKLCCNCL